MKDKKQETSERILGPLPYWTHPSQSTLATSPMITLSLWLFSIWAEMIIFQHICFATVRVWISNVGNWLAMERSENTWEELRGLLYSFAMTAPIERIWYGYTTAASISFEFTTGLWITPCCTDSPVSISFVERPRMTALELMIPSDNRFNWTFGVIVWLFFGASGTTKRFNNQVAPFTAFASCALVIWWWSFYDLNCL